MPIERLLTIRSKRGAAPTAAVLAAMAALSLPPTAMTASAPKARQGSTGNGGPQQLWRKYPLRQPSQPPASHPKISTGGARSNTQPGSRPGQSRTWLWLVIVTALTFCAAATVAAILWWHVRHRRGNVARLRFRGGKRDRGQEPAADKLTDAGARVAPFVESTPGAALTVEQSVPTGRDLDRLGDHVSSIVSAAETAAVRIQEEARQEAERVREQEQKEGAARAEAAREDADAIWADAERLRTEAEESTTQTRQAADTYAADTRAEAEAQARKLLTAAERQAAESKDADERRQHALKADISLSEDRLRQLATGLRELAARLDKLLATSMGDGDEDDFNARDEDSLLVAAGSPREAQKATRE